MSMVTATDRLMQLSTYRLTLLHNQFTTPDAVLTAGGSRLAELHIHRAAIVQLVRQGDPDVMLALFLPRPGPIDWGVTGSAHDADLRLLSVTRRIGAYSVDVILDRRYRVDDDGSQERAAWIALRDALRGAQPAVAQGYIE